MGARPRHSAEVVRSHDARRRFKAAGYQVFPSPQGEGILIGAIKFAPGATTGSGPCAYGRTEVEAHEMLWLTVIGDLPDAPA